MISASYLAEKAARWQELSGQLRQSAKPVVKLPAEQKLIRIDLSASNQELASIDVVNASAINSYIQIKLEGKGAAGAIGGYLENRLLYLRSAVFAGLEHRTLHLGIDIWLPAGAAVFAPLSGRVHSFADNASFGDYGPTIILEHQWEEFSFYSLYGHLSRQSLLPLAAGMPIEAGEQIATLGCEAENGNWPAHLHFQLMLDMEGRLGDFPGVAAPSHQTFYEQLCPDPTILLNFAR